MFYYLSSPLAVWKQWAPDMDSTRDKIGGKEATEILSNPVRTIACRL